MIIKNHSGTHHQLRKFYQSFGSIPLLLILDRDGNNHDTITGLNKKYRILAYKICTGYIPKNKAWLALKSTILSMLDYYFTSLTFTEVKFKKILSHIIQTGLSYIGIRCNFCLAGVNGPVFLQGHMAMDFNT